MEVATAPSLGLEEQGGVVSRCPSAWTARVKPSPFNKDEAAQW